MNLTLNDPWFDLVRTGKKLYEGRRRTPKVSLIQPGEILTIAHHTDKARIPFSVKVEETLEFASFEAALTALPIEQVLPVPDITIAQGVEIYKKFVSIPTQERDGVVMLKVSLCD